MSSFRNWYITDVLGKNGSTFFFNYNDNTYIYLNPTYLTAIVLKIYELPTKLTRIFI